MDHSFLSLTDVLDRAEHRVRAGVSSTSTSATGQVPMVVVDYLQKVSVPHGPFGEDEQVTHVVE